MVVGQTPFYRGMMSSKSIEISNDVDNEIYIDTILLGYSIYVGLCTIYMLTYRQLKSWWT